MSKAAPLVFVITNASPSSAENHRSKQPQLETERNRLLEDVETSSMRVNHHSNNDFEDEDSDSKHGCYRCCELGNMLVVHDTIGSVVG
ncbi:hypothetical protein AGABI2DRAFT_138099 [Agaricus bisporus var. bisporus H97]|uniref:hypothetical protein n=1 Tax=Agaricus bisporus var. bisporus (strain H97 / ATCC MYA-4626 / FGSC 10389) TaxID=936046 RepID=UPI00029F5CED|nr:hypothetical protein AGABI2DRAFT_138099 [Agaricus bisporus var. bisporus H97]EKV44494.1 hypothetical protein AGABI2DRAFT_138099 [Agaricus bisporus var. bisporus H97]